MACIRPFNGTRYDTQKAGAYETLVAPPYDVISEAMRDELYQKNEHNIIRLILGKEGTEDSEADNKYTRAKDHLAKWIKDGVLVTEPSRGLYVHEQRYEHNGRDLKRVGFIALVKIDDGQEQNVMPHESTLSKPKADRLSLIGKVEANLSPIFSVFDDSDTGIIERLKSQIELRCPRIDFSLNGERALLWDVTDSEVIEEVARRIKGKKLFIADGHHRYEVAKAYRDELRKRPDYDGRADYVMMYLTDLSEANDLTVMATHRVVRSGIPAGTVSFEEYLADLFDFIVCPGLEDLMDRVENTDDSVHAFGCFFDGRYIYLKPKENSKMRELLSEEKDEPGKILDVSFLHSAILEKFFPAGENENNITYVREASEAVDLVKSGSHGIAFLLKATPVQQMKSVAEAGEMMPQKSTYFYPKLFTGLVIHKF